jgi:hypothetical protein
MSEIKMVATPLVQELKVTAHLMTLHPGVFCIYHLEGSGSADPANGLPGVRLTLPPGPDSRNVTISSFWEDGWLGSIDSAALVRVSAGPAQILLTVYMLPGAPAASAPKLQVMRLSDARPATVAEHIEGRGDAIPEQPKHAGPAELIAAQAGRPEKKRRPANDKAAKSKRS